jgi:hypothetical protein
MLVRSAMPKLPSQLNVFLGAKPLESFALFRKMNACSS